MAIIYVCLQAVLTSKVSLLCPHGRLPFPVWLCLFSFCLPRSTFPDCRKLVGFLTWNLSEQENGSGKMRGSKIYHVEWLGDWELEDKKNQTVRKAILKLVFGTTDSPSSPKGLNDRQFTSLSYVIILKIIIKGSLIELGRAKKRIKKGVTLNGSDKRPSLPHCPCPTTHHPPIHCPGCPWVISLYQPWRKDPPDFWP